MRLAVTCRSCLATALALLSAGQVFAQEPGLQDFPKMKYGFFVHYVWIGTNDPVYYPATRNPDGSLPAGLDDLANRFDAAGFANDLASMGVQYVLFTAWHNNMNCLWPSPAMNRWLKGHTSRRDVLRDMIAAVKGKGIKVLLYTQASEGYTLSAAEQAATGWGPTFKPATWNPFINELYADLISRYGNDIEGLYFDGDVVDTRLLNNIRAINPNLVLIRNGPSSGSYDYGDIENNWFYAAGTNAWVAPALPSAIVMGSTWWTSVRATVPNAAKYPAPAIFRYTVLMAGVSQSAGGPAWAAGVYPGGGWEPGVLSTMQAVGAYIGAIGPSLKNTYASTAYVTPAGATIASLPWGVVATRSIDDAYEYIHVLTPPTGNTLILPPPADRKIFGSARLLASGQPATLIQNSAGVRLSLQGTNAWNSLDTVIALTVVGVAPHKAALDVSAPILSPPASQSVVPGRSVSFNVLAGSATPPTYQWQAGAVGSGVYTNLVDGGQISGATSNVLTISDATTNWALDYVVVVRNMRSSVTSSPPATLMMQYLPVIITPPASQGAVAGQTVSFSVTASGASYQWQAGPVGGPYTNLVDGPQVSGSTASTLTISNLTTNWLLAYQAVVIAPYGSITSAPPALLTYIQTNYLDFSPTTVGSWSGPVSPADGVTSIGGAGLNVGDRVVFDGLVICTNAHALSACQAWGGVELNQGGDDGLWGAALGTLVRFSSDYPCFLWIDGFGPGTFPGTYGRLTNRVRIELTATEAGSTANMNYLVEIDQGLTGRFNSSLSGTGVYFSGDTIALTFNVGFCAPDSAQFVNYKPIPPTITAQPLTQTMAAGADATFSVTVSGAPPLSYHWRKNGTNVANTSHISGATKPSLTIRKVTIADAANYSVLVSNPFGITLSSNAVLTVFVPDTTKPTSTIISPTAGQRWSNAVITVQGTAKDNVGVAGVWCLINGVWRSATTGNGWTNWALEVALAPGTNVVKACAEDGAGNWSSTNGVSFVYVVSDGLGVEATGPCTMSPNYSNAVLEVGKKYTMTATPGGGYVLSNWMGSVLGDVVLVSNAATVSFMMQSNLVLRANIIPNPFIAVKGSYNGLFAQTDRVQASSGFVTLTLTTNGSYSGSLKQGSSSYAMSGQFDVAGQTSKVVARSGTNAWAVAMQLDFAGRQLLGWVSNGVSGGWVANLLADRVGFDNRTNPATLYLGKFTMRIPGDTEPGAPVFAGDGYLTLSVATNGQITYGGSLADGNAVASGAAVVCRDGHVPLYAPLYSGKGSLWGWLAFDTNQPAKGFEGWMSWIKPAGMGALYPLGLTNEVIAEGTRYVTPTKSLDRVIEMTNGMVIFEGGNLSLPLTNLVMLTESNKVIDVSLTNGLNLSLTLSNGAFGGSVRQPGTTRSNVFKGVLLQNESVGYGYFLETNRSGRVVFRPEERVSP